MVTRWMGMAVNGHIYKVTVDFRVGGKPNNGLTLQQWRRATEEMSKETRRMRDVGDVVMHMRKRLPEMITTIGIVMVEK